MTDRSETSDAPLTQREAIGLALGRIPSGLFVLTAKFEERRAAMLVSWVQQASFDPPIVSVAVAKGRHIMPLISDSHAFALCQIGKADRVLLRKFAGKFPAGEDPFMGFELVTNTATQAPVLAGAMAYMECQLTTHLDIEGDHDIFIGRIVGAGYKGDDPHVHLRESGFNY